MIQILKPDKQSQKKELNAPEAEPPKSDLEADAKNEKEKRESYSDHDLAAFQEKMLHIHLP